MVLNRGNISSRISACLDNAFFLKLHHISLFHPSINLKNIINIDKSKIDRETATVKVSNHQKHLRYCDNLICIGVYCRVDKDTFQYKNVTERYNGNKKLYIQKRLKCSEDNMKVNFPKVLFMAKSRATF